MAPMELSFDLEPGDDAVYVAEAIEQIERIERGLLELEQDAADEAVLGEIFRAAHTLKGSAATIGHGRMTELTHALEEVFGALRAGRLTNLEAFDDLLLPTVDTLRVLVDEVEAGHTLTDIPQQLARDIVERLAAALSGGFVTGGPTSVSPEASDSAPAISTLPSDAPSNDNAALIAARLDAGRLDRLRTESGLVEGRRTVITFAVDAVSAWSGVRLLQALMAATDSGRLLGSVPAMEEIEAGTGGSVLSLLLKGSLAETADLLDRLRSMDDSVRAEADELDEDAATTQVETAGPATREAGSTTRSVAHTIRIDVGQLDDLMNLVGELIVQKTRLKRQAKQLAMRLGEDALATEAEDGARQFAQIVDRLQAGVTQLRMMPIEAVFNRFPRLVRDLSAQLGKDVGLTLDGQETELDRSLLEEVGDPIAHLVRNALDHGIEAAPERAAAGKPVRGSIRVSARHADGRVVVEVADDGRGIDPRAISRAAIERGLVDEASVAAMTESDALRLIFLPGFSTAREVTNVSGRGVGMDVVRTNVERLGGQVSISSTRGAGTTIAMSLPLTLAIIDALLVRSGRRICAIPLGSVIETQRVPVADVRTVSSRPVLSLARGIVSLQPLGRAMGDPDDGNTGDGFVRAVLVRSRGAELALGVDEFLGTEEIVLKSLGLPGQQPNGVVGATILADGGVALVVDVDRLSGPDRALPRSA
jgi:two-component system chemotaxis sensor kinase CheA